MQVKELLIEALCRASHVQRGYPADAKEIEAAKVAFNSQLRKYSDRNLITAYQKVLDFTAQFGKTIIGRPTMKKGCRLHVIGLESKLPDLSTYNPTTNNYGYIMNRDCIWVNQMKRLYEITVSGSTYSWTSQGQTTLEKYCDVIPDVICMDMEKIMASMYKNDYNGWEKMDFVPLTLFYTDDRSDIYYAGNYGENKIHYEMKSDMMGKNIKLVYNSAMKFEKNDYLELPDAHIELLTLAVTCAILKEDVDADPQALNNFKEELKELENQIIAQSASTRKIERPHEHQRYGRLEALYTGSFIYGR